MISKIKNIKNLAVFQNFEWDKSVLSKDNIPLEFKRINILYGRNYSGKTTLSRIFRAMETGELSDKYETPHFCVTIKGESEVTSNNPKSHSKKIRVFNEDFVRDNLKFISDPDKSIESFAILGDDNNKTEKEIKAIESDLGSNEEGKETGLYNLLKSINEKLKTATSSYQSAKNKLEKQLKAKATDREIGIKYKSERFGDQNYTIKKLGTDIKAVLKENFTKIDNEKQVGLEKLLNEKTNAPIPSIPSINLELNTFSEQTEKLVTKKIGVSDKIAELTKDAVLNRWVKEGRSLHKEKRDICGFCGNSIKKDRWAELDKHFDEESEQLEKEIDSLVKDIEDKKKSVIAGFKPDKDLFYSKFQSSISKLIKDYASSSKKYSGVLDSLIEQLKNRKNDLINPKRFDQLKDFKSEITTIFDKYEIIRTESNKFTDLLSTEQAKAKAQLRLRDVYDFVVTIKYTDEHQKIEDLKTKETKEKLKKEKVAGDILGKNDLIESLKRKLNDEEKGAIKVNEYLNDFFGHGFLTLKAVENQESEEDEKKIHFEIVRDGKKAHHLSEGECSLIAFCYFMAKLEDIDTKGIKPIIWIDDPVSSLDGNHIFFVYSLIKLEIADNKKFEQLFVSTHNLDFLKYLKRLPGGNSHLQKKESKRKHQYFVIQRNDKLSTISLMPDYLIQFVTEFNYLFHQIHKCSEITVVDDSNYTTFYNFGNNARKFLEIYLYYKFPDNSKDIEKMQKFFGDEKIPAVLTDRINNEYSHLCGVFERGSTPVEVPEMKSAAELIIKRLKKDKDQFDSLLKSIGVENAAPKEAS
jgi:wobble nucleotide-excising tRNase